ncbi:ATP-binding protein [Salmonella enterica]|nr:ATP-binding protein [Salmonella enterica]EBP3563911.1 ATP-binding protein [Salmonella enterica subsp. enterica]EDT1318849.1 ATP-binding protein [Salmonella enterica subsp. enterica serovar Mississippi]EAX9069402.1 ATP-binding protein [Salmonella enterica]EBI7610881.1 ATP-binding protein [Salmonella enterica]
MKLTGMAAALSSQMEQPGTYEEPSFRERLALLVTRESLERDQRKQKRLLQKARLRLEASVHDIDYQQGYSVQYWRLSRLLVELTHSRADGSYRKQLAQLSKTQLLILDDWGLEPLLPAQRNDLLELMDDRYGKNATVMISQLPTDEWYGCVGDNTLADVILDRLMHNSHRLEMKGESMRKRLAQVD